ncbi:hypothetical protein AK812_SmicGene24134 [Symbiodinium microadriaticum]|uniref:Major facilitator superfamily (MFS) profile domain-containing protein n=1 Tax=Symbiodinium microadriaticum TaxID=2951 RepID=A0A1Q9DFF1_SYMMI|nr:hypothetical protein AK812_SmicGene24134 [Symbiodinium microadriaticum]
MMRRLDLAQVSFACCVLVNMVDVMGMFFTAPVMVPYGQQIGASTAEIAGFTTVRFSMAVISLLWMPRLADTKGVKLCILISVFGTAIAYGLQGNAYLFSGCERQLHSMRPGDSMNLWEGHECIVVNGTVGIVESIGNSSEVGLATALGSGGVLECTEDCGNKAGVYVMMAGRALAGFFGGTQPVLRAYVTQISLPNMALVKLRSTVLFASMQAGNFALAPIAGVISRFGLHWPWYVSTGVAVLCLVFVTAFFKNKEDIVMQSKKKVDAEEGEQVAEPVAAAPTVTPHVGPPPIKDKILLLMLLAYWCVFQCVAALILLLPLLLEYESFGLMDPTSLEKSRESLAAATSMVMVPHGVANFAMSTVGFLILSSKIGDRATMRVGATLAAVLLCFYGYASSELWHLLVLHGFVGVGLGLMVPAIAPTLQRYNTLAHPEKTSQAAALPLFGMQLGQIFGPLLFGLITGDTQDRSRMNLAWLVAGLSFLTGMLLMDFCFTLISRHPVMRKLTYTPEQIKTMLETNAQEEEVFVDDMCKLLRGMLTQGSPEYRGIKLWSGVAQRFVARVLRETIPKMREDPEEHLEDVAAWIAKVGTDADLDYFHAKFPHIPRHRRWQSDAYVGEQQFNDVACPSQCSTAESSLFPRSQALQAWELLLFPRTAGRPFNNDEEKEEEEENEEEEEDDEEGEEDHGEEEDDSIDDMAMPVMLPFLMIVRDDGYAAAAADDDDDDDDKYDE